MAKKILAVDGGGIYYNCPVTEQGLFDVPNEVKLRHRRNPKRTEVIFRCDACGDRHFFALQEA